MATVKPKPRGGARPAAGRKPLSDAGAASAPVSIRLRPEQKLKLEMLGGPEWVRQMIDLARL